METENKSSNTPIVLITGGSGFLGSRIVSEFLDADSPVKAANVYIFDLKEYPGPADERIRFIRGDIRNYEEVSKACKGMDIVIHSAAIVDWGTRSESEIYAVNVSGTENVIKACQENNVPYLVYTSSLDAIFGGKPLVGIDETVPYPEKHPNSYCRSKYLSEIMVKEANKNGLKTVILRPSDIYGEADPYHIDSLINMAKGGFYVRLGNGKPKSQHVYVGNMAYAHVLAGEALLNNKGVDGNVYFITDGPGANFFHFFDKVVMGAGYKIWPKNLWLPRGFAYSIGFLSEMIALLVRPIKRYTPKFSRFAVIYTCTDFMFSSDKAKNELGFIPKYKDEEAFERTISYYRERNLKNK
jgi:nucleoside-diphosphate-sugar epimerase